MYRLERGPSIWWSRARLLSSVLSALSFAAFIVLVLLKVDGHSGVKYWSWQLVCAPPLGACVLFFGIYCAIRYATRHAPFTYTSDAAATYLLAIKTTEMDEFHQVWVFRDVLVGLSFALLGGYGIAMSLSPCKSSCNTPYSLLSIGGACLYFLRLFHMFRIQGVEWNRLRLLVREVAFFQEFLDQNRLFHQVLPDLHESSKSTQAWMSVFLFLASAILAALGSVWVINRNCFSNCPATYLSAKYFLYGMVMSEFLYLASEMYLVYARRVSGVEAIEGLIDRLENESQQERRKLIQLRKAEKQRRKNDSTSTR